MTMPAAQARDIRTFGPFRLIASERLLLKDGAPVELGARALDILIALTSQPNEPIGKRDLLARVWPDVTVDEGSLRFHIVNLRKALGDGQNGARYITTLAGRGYCFVAPLSRASDPVSAPAVASPNIPQANLPGRLLRMVGRDGDIESVQKLLRAERFVTIVGGGGVGKTSVAVAVAHDMMASFADGVLFIDLGLLSAPGLAGTAMASMMGLPVESDDLTPSLVAFLRDQRKLLILDTCEHLLDTVAPLAAQLFAEAPHMHILATSREALRVEGEHVYKLAPLALPPEDAKLTPSAAQTFPAVRLFMERASAGGARLEFSDADAEIAAEICRRLDGVALAIELAAGRVGTYGLQQTAALLDQRLSLQWPGQRTAPARQKTLQATLEWSYGLLSDEERIVLRRIAVFVGPFTMEAAVAIVTNDRIDPTTVFSAIDSLVAKSMLATRPAGAMMRYRLLDPTRAYALSLEIAEVGQSDLAARHATYYLNWLKQNAPEVPPRAEPMRRLPLLTGLHNVRAALEWAFAAGGDTALGVELAAAAAPMFLAMSLLPECRRWSERALAALPAAAHGGVTEMRLQAALGLTLQSLDAAGVGARKAIDRARAIADERDDTPTSNLLRALSEKSRKASPPPDLDAAARHLAAL